MKVIGHPAFVNLFNKDKDIFGKLLKDADTLSKLTNRIKKISGSYQDLAYKDADKVKGDLFEIFAECFFKVLPVYASINGGWGIYGYEQAPAVDDYGVDGFGVGMDEKPLTVQVKFRSNPTEELTQDDIKQFAFQSIVEYGVDKDTTTNMIVFTNAKGLHWVTESKVFSGRIRVIGSDEIAKTIDKNTIFWKMVGDLIQETIKEKYS
jgi:hypothetical protein